MLRFVLALLVAGITATAHAELPVTAEARANELKQAIKSFRLELVYQGQEEKPFYRLILSVPAIKDDRNNSFYRIVQVSEGQASKIIDRLAGDGFLTLARDVRPKQELRRPTEPGYTLRVGAYCEDLRWGLPMLKRLDGLRKVLDGDAANGMDFLLARLSGLRKQWEKEAGLAAHDDKAALQF